MAEACSMQVAGRSCAINTARRNAMTNNDTVTHELSIEELDSVAGGDFSWKGFVGAVAGGAAAGGLGGAAGGPAGAGAGALSGGLLGGIAYCVSSIF
jgi:uncharacterized protein YcfJ